MKKIKHFIVPLAAILILTLISSFYLFSDEAHSPTVGQNITTEVNDVEATVTECKKAEDSRELTQEWLTQDTLQVNTHINMLCGGANIVDTSYEINGSDLTIKYGIMRDKYITRCVCDKSVSFKISGVERRDYDVKLEYVE